MTDMPDGGGAVGRIAAPLLGWLLATLATQAALAYLLPLYPVPSVVLAAISLLALTVAYLVRACRGPDLPWRAGLAGAVLLLLGFGISFLAPGTEMAATLFYLASAPVLGNLLARLFEKKEYLVPALLVTAVADTWSVFHGLSSVLVEHQVAERLATSHPIPLADRGAVLFLPAIGVMDWIMLSALFRFLIRFSLPRRGFYLAVGFGMIAAFALLAFLGQSVPLFLTIAPLFALCYYRATRPHPRDLVTTLLFLLALMALFGLLTLVRN